MGKKIVVDTSTGGLDYYPFGHDIKILRIRVFLDEQGYLDGSELKADDFYRMLRERPELIPRTSQPSIGEVVDFFENLYEQGYDEFYVTTISSKLSGTHNVIKLASEQLKDKMHIHVFDTLTVCFFRRTFCT